MLFPEGDAPLLKAWIVRRLSDTSDADADVLADYVLALLRHDGDADSIRRLFEEEIPDFLRDDSGPFTDDVFQAVKYRTYLPGAPPAPPIFHRAAPTAQTPQASHAPQGPFSQQQPHYQAAPPSMFPETHTPYAETPAAFSNPSFRNGSRKRSYRDLDAPDAQLVAWDTPNPSPYQQNGPPPYKQARRGGFAAPRGGRVDEPYGGRARGSYNGYNPNSFPINTLNSEPPGYNPNQPFEASPLQAMPQLDERTILENIRQLQEIGAQLGIPIPQTGGSLPRPVYSGPAMMPPQSQRRRQPCRDYETRGFCSRGNRCQFEHGTGSVYLPSFTASQGDEYNPNDAAILPRPALLHPGQPPRGSEKIRPDHRELKKNKRKDSRAPFSHAGSMSDKSKTQIVVENIPEENFTEDGIRAFFAQFGTIEEISLRPSLPKHIAIVKYDSWAAANAAWKSPKVVFDNRFVKIYWYKDEFQVTHDVKPVNGARHGSVNSHANDEPTPEEPGFDVEEFKRKQEEAQKLHEEKTQKREALERQRQELEEKQRELTSRQQEEKRKLQARLAAIVDKDASLSPILSRPSTDKTKNTQAEALRAKLAELEAEANSLGLDPEAAHEEGSWAPRGRGRGRRPYVRGRGSYPPRSSRGGYGYRNRGGGGVDVHAAYAAYSLDNRPKIIALSGVDFTEPAKDEALRQYLFSIGEFEAMYTDPTTTHVKFKDRKTAEQFMFGVSAKKTIPGVEGKLELAWASSAPKAAGADGDFPAASGSEEEHAAKAAEENVDQGGTFGDGAEDTADVRDQADMDYEGGDWDIS